MRPVIEKGKETLISGSLRWPLKEGTFQLSPDKKDPAKPLLSLFTGTCS